MTRSLSVEVGLNYISVKGCSEVGPLINRHYSRHGEEVELSTYVEEDIVIIHFPPVKGPMGPKLTERFKRLQQLLTRAGYNIISSSDYRGVFKEERKILPFVSALVH